MADALRVQQKFPQGHKFKGAVSHVDSISSFYVQISPYEEFEELQNKIQSYCEGITNRCFLTPKKGHLALAQFEEHWYRAKILEVTSSSAEVLFVDFGNKSTVTNDQMLSLPPQYRELPFQAIHCNLYLPESCDKNSEEVIQNFKSLTEDFEMEGEVKDIGAKSSLYLVDLKIEGESIASKIFDELASERNGESSNNCEPENELRSYETLDLGTATKNPSTTEESSVNESTKLETSTLSDSYSLLKLPTLWQDGLTKRVIITAYDKDFLWCIDESDADSVSRLTDNINSHYNNTAEVTDTLSRVIPGEVYCVKKDGKWHRIIVQKTLPAGNEYEVQSIDHGKWFLVEREELRNLEEKFIWQPRCCRKLSLFNRGLILNEDVINNIMKKLILSKSKLQIKIEKTTEDTHFVSIAIKSLDLLNDILALPKAVCTLSELTTKFKDYPIECCIPTNLSRELECYVSHVESITEFYVQPTFWERNLEEITNTLNDIYPKQSQDLQLMKPGKGMFCIAKYSEDECYYRAKILSCEDSAAMVQFIDYGNYDEVSTSQLFVMVDKLTTRSQCIKCSLNNVKDTVSVSAVLDEVNDKTLICKFYINSDTLIADLYDGQRHLNKIFSPDLAPINEKVNLKTVEPCPIDFSLERQEVRLLHVDNPNTYFVRPQNLETKFSKINEVFSSSDMASIPNLPNVTSGSICAININHKELVGSWFRGIILEVRGGKSRVRLLDEGKVFIFENTSIKMLPNALLDLPACAVECHLLGLQVPENGWSKTEKRVLTSSYPKLQSIVQVIFKNKAEGLLRTELYTPCGLNVSRKLEEIRSNLSEQDIEESVKSGFSAVSINKTNFDLDRNKSTLEKEFNLPLKQFVQDVKYESYVSHYENPESFWIQLQSDEKEIEVFNSDLQANCELTNEEFDFTPGEYCCAFSNEFESWYRCLVLKRKGAEVEVRYVDFGNIETLNVKNLVPMPKTCLSIPPFATKVSLTNEFTNEQSIELKEQMGEECIIVKITSASEPWQVDVNLFGVGDLRQTIFKTSSIIKNNREIHIEPKITNSRENLDLNTEKITITDHELVSGDVQAYVSAVESPSKFWMQLVSDNCLISHVLQCLNDEPSCLCELLSPTVGDYCVAKSNEDNTWYRAKITAVQEEDCEVFFVDYGNKEFVTKNMLKVITKNLAETNKLAIEASLLSVTEPKDGWNTKDIELFEEKILDKELICRICNSNLPIQVILNDDDQCINAFFIETTKNKKAPKESLSYPPQIIPTTEEKGRITHVNKKGDIFVQLNKDDEELDTIFGLLEDFTKYPLMGEVVNNSPVLALFEGEWFRAIITRSEPEIDVFFVDYGNSSTVASKGLRCPDENILSFPPLAYCFKGYVSGSVTQKTIDNLLEIEDLDVSFLKPENELGLNGAELMETMWLKDKNLCSLENIPEYQNELSLNETKDDQINRSEIEQRKIFETTYEDISEENETQSPYPSKEQSIVLENTIQRETNVFHNSPNYESFKDMAILESTRVDEYNSVRDESYQISETDRTHDSFENSKLDTTEENLVKNLVSRAITKVCNCLALYDCATQKSNYVGFPLTVGQQLVVQVISFNDNSLVVKNLDIPQELEKLDGSSLERDSGETAPAVALASNGKWVRVKTVSSKDGMSQVFAVDCGFILEVPTDHLRAIEDEAIKLIPGQVFVCHLVKQAEGKMDKILSALEEQRQCIIDIEVESINGCEPAYISIVSVINNSREDFSLNGTITIDDQYT